MKCTSRVRNVTRNDQRRSEYEEFHESIERIHIHPSRQSHDPISPPVLCINEHYTFTHPEQNAPNPHGHPRSGVLDLQHARTTKSIARPDRQTDLSARAYYISRVVVCFVWSACGWTDESVFLEATSQMGLGRCRGHRLLDCDDGCGIHVMTVVDLMILCASLVRVKVERDATADGIRISAFIWGVEPKWIHMFPIIGTSEITTHICWLAIRLDICAEWDISELRSSVYAEWVCVSAIS